MKVLGGKEKKEISLKNLHTMEGSRGKEGAKKIRKRMEGS